MCCRTSSHLYLYYYSAALMLIYYKLTQIIATGETVIFRILYVISKRGVCLWFLSSHTSFADQENPYSIKVHVPGPWRACTSVQSEGWRLSRGQTVMRPWLVRMNTSVWSHLEKMPEYSKSPKTKCKQQIYVPKALWGTKTKSTWDIEQEQIQQFESFRSHSSDPIVLNDVF